MGPALQQEQALLLAPLEPLELLELQDHLHCSRLQ